MPNDPIDESIKRINATSDQVDAFTGSLKTFLRQNIKKILKGLDGEKVAAQEAAAMLGSLRSELEAAGLDEMIQSLDATYAQQILDVKAKFEAMGATEALSSADRTMVETLINFDLEKITSKLDLYVDDTKSVLMRSILGGESIDVSSILETSTPILENQINAEINTGLAAFNRSVSAAKAEEVGYNFAEYYGPDDQVTRDFCRETLEARDPPIYTIEEIQKMNNGTDIPVLTGGGGYNCRHHWIFMDQAQAEAKGWTPKQA